MTQGGGRSISVWCGSMAMFSGWAYGALATAANRASMTNAEAGPGSGRFLIRLVALLQMAPKC